jgi:hypothetical protein
VLIELWHVLFSVNGGKEYTGSIVIPLASYSQGARFFPQFHEGQGCLATEAITVVKVQP